MTKRLLLVVVLVLAVGLPLAYAQKGAGKPFGARDPQPCGSRKAPAKGAPSAAQAAQYITCDREAVDAFGYLGQLSDLKVEVSKGHAFTMYDQAPNIDVSQTVYGIRGSFKAYHCAVVDGAVTLADKNCMTSEFPTANGNCYKDNFGDWHCGLQGIGINAKFNMPPLK
jgi:hypothetical protein